ncbi:MAG: sigma-54 dependent transcriptional regulator [Rubrivivax sp.]|nr:sigma-54 dependent transcriptional regulator [Rubrivivax sp.]
MNAPLRDSPSTAPDWASLNLIGRSASFRATLGLLQQCAGVDATVLLCGETGTGKELAARAIHYLSARRSGPFVPVNCGALPDSILEAELFGHTKGAFTDARSDSRGLIGLAQGGTLFFDEVDSLSPRAQSAILRFVQDRCYRPLGSARIERADVRLVAATNADLDDLVRCGRFRQDLLFRLNLLAVALPPLREREGDALLLARVFVQRLVAQYRSEPRELAAASVAALQQPRPWPGNVRELEHGVHRAFLLQRGDAVDLRLPAAAGAPAAAAMARGDRAFADAKAAAIRDFERSYLHEVLQRAGGNLSLAARIAGKERSRFGKLVRKHGLHRAGPVSDL